MRLVPRTLTGRLLAVVVGAVFVAQGFVLLLLITATDSKMDQYERAFITDRIVSVYKYSRDADLTGRRRMFEAATNSDLHFSVTGEPPGVPLETLETTPFRGILEGIDAPVRVWEQNVRLRDTLNFWLEDEEESCFLNHSPRLTKYDCPFWRVSVRYPDGTWMAATGLPAPNAVLFLTPLILAALFSLAGITVIVALLTRRLTGPLQQLSIAADRVGRGEKVEALPETGPREFASVMSAFNAMQQRITRFVEDRTTMLAGVSHDLRTPITSLRLRSEFVSDPELQQKMIESLDEMQTMVESYLFFARQDISDEKLQEFDFVDLFQRMDDATTGMTFSTSLNSCCYLGRKMSIQRAFSNVVGNAIAYGSAAHVTLSTVDGFVRITVDDPGDGVPENCFEEIFFPFTRLDDARTVTSGSVGLGLSIARTIIRKHGGDIQPSALKPGFRMSVELPSNSHRCLKDTNSIC